MTHALPDIDNDLHQLHQATGLTAVVGGLGLVGELEKPEFEQLACSAVGKLRSDEEALVNAQDLWHIGSVLKPMTATLLAILQDAQELSFSETLPELLPGFALHADWQGVTLHHLLTHTAGLPANFPLSARTKDPTTDVERQALRAEYLARALAKRPRVTPGKKFRYSNLGYTLAGHCAEVRLQQPFRQLIRERLWLPLDMQSAGFGPPLVHAGRDQPLGHRTLFCWRFPQDPRNGQVDNSSIMDPAGCAHMTIEDLLRFGRVHLGSQWPDLHAPALQDYACGWVVHSPEPKPYPLLWHNGSNTLWYCLLVLAPEQKAVVALATNDGAMRKAEMAFFKLAYRWLDALA